jgi:hypothetical protein
MRYHLRISLLLALAAGGSLGPAAPARAFPAVCSVTPTSVSAVPYPSISLGGGLVLPPHVGVSWTMAEDAGACAPLQTIAMFNTYYVPEFPPQTIDSTTSHWLWTPGARADSFLGVPHQQRFSFCVSAGVYNGSVLNFITPKCTGWIWIP